MSSGSKCRDFEMRRHDCNFTTISGYIIKFLKPQFFRLYDEEPGSPQPSIRSPGTVLLVCSPRCKNDFQRDSIE